MPSYNYSLQFYFKKSESYMEQQLKIRAFQEFMGACRVGQADKLHILKFDCEKQRDSLFIDFSNDAND